MINASRVKIKIVNFTTFSLLFRDRFAKIGFLAKSEIHLKDTHNNVIIINEFFNVRNDNRDDDI